MNRWRRNNDVIIQKIYLYVKNKILYKTYILDFSYLEK